MATYKVKPSDNYSKIAEQYQVPVSTLVKLNRQAPLSAGMTIKVPKSKGGFIGGSPLTVAPMQPGMDLQNPYNAIAPTPAPAFGKTRAPTVPAWGQLSAYEQGVATQQAAIRPLAQGSFVSGSGSVNLQGYQPAGGRGTMLPSAADFQTIGSVLGPQPTGTYTGGNSANDQAWRDLWNQQAANGDTHNNGEFPGFWGGGKNGGFFKTLREARMATRRKRINDEEQDMGRPVYSQPEQVKPILGERQQTVTWNIGG